MGSVEKLAEPSTKNAQPTESRTPSTEVSAAKPGETRLERLAREIAQSMVESLRKHTANLPD